MISSMNRASDTDSSFVTIASKDYLSDVGDSFGEEDTFSENCGEPSPVVRNALFGVPKYNPSTVPPGIAAPDLRDLFDIPKGGGLLNAPLGAGQQNNVGGIAP